ncbi:MAG: TetR/AcrR family transcriptional regulator [Tissierellales bacterium]|jgi:AcrR family transcriptional regulator|nr:TetR/AcrR family transcriptional regulator [Tissierellales bacterium]
MTKNNTTRLQIIQEANNLFKELNYEDVDMRRIAKNSNVAVGTLYNYFKGKEDLYMSILKDSWQKTFKSLDDIENMDLTPMDKVYKFFEVMEEDKKKRNHLSKKIIHRILDEKSECNSDEFFRHWIDYLDSKLAVFLKSADKNNYYDENEYKILSHALIGSFFSMHQHYEKEEKRIKFFKKYLSMLLNSEVIHE